jgi:hypothetical protein
MKKLIMLVLLVVLSGTLGAVNIIKVWPMDDEDINIMVQMLIFTQQDIEQKEKLTLPNPYSYYTQLLGLTKKFKFSVDDMPEEGRAFLDVLIEDVSGAKAVTEFAPILHNNFANKELQLAIIYLYVIHRYHNQNKLRWETYERVVGSIHGKELKKNEIKYTEIIMRAFIQSQEINE